MEELKPCQFCGSENCETYKVDETVFSQNQYLTMREDMMKLILWGAGCYDCSAQVYGFDTEQEAIEAWNTRAERTCENVSEYCNEFYCSNCGCELDFITDNDAMRGGRPNYCPNCGAKVKVS